MKLLGLLVMIVYLLSIYCLWSIYWYFLGWTSSNPNSFVLWSSLPNMCIKSPKLSQDPLGFYNYSSQFKTGFPNMSTHIICRQEMNVIKEGSEPPLGDRKAAGGLEWAEGLSKIVARDLWHIEKERDRNQKMGWGVHSQVKLFYFQYVSNRCIFFPTPTLDFHPIK